MSLQMLYKYFVSLALIPTDEKKNFIEILQDLIRYRSENIFVGHQNNYET